MWLVPLLTLLVGNVTGVLIGYIMFIPPPAQPAELPLARVLLTHGGLVYLRRRP